jgi:hypothetical protein
MPTHTKRATWAFRLESGMGKSRPLGNKKQTNAKRNKDLLKLFLEWGRGDKGGGWRGEKTEIRNTFLQFCFQCLFKKSAFLYKCHP